MSAPRATATFEKRGICPPSKESVTVGESDLKFIHLRNGEDTSLLQYVRNGGIAFPHIMVPDALQLRGAAKTSKSSGAPANGVSIMRKQVEATPQLDQQQQEGNEAVEVVKSSELKSVLETATSHALWLWNAKDHASEFVSHKRMQALLMAESWLPVPLARAVFGRVSGTASAARTEALEVEEAEGQRNMLTKTEGPISYIAWHPHRSLVAIAHRATDTVFLYDLAHDSWCSNVLQNAYMQGITSLAWQPNCGYSLAVGCTAGVCLWSMLPAANSQLPADSLEAPGLGTAQFSAWMTLMSFPPLDKAYEYPARLPQDDKLAIHRSASSVSALAFSSCGQWLVTGHQTHGHLTVWDVALGSATPVRRSGSSSGSATLQVEFSPNGCYVVSTHASGHLRLWETKGWNSRVWSELCVNVSQFAWAPDSRSLFFAVAGSADIYALALHKPPPSLEAEITMITSFEAHATAPSDDSSDDAERIRVGGAIKSLALDPKGQRLVVSFDDDSASASADISLLAVYLVNTGALFRAGASSSALMPLGYVRGPGWGKQHKLDSDSALQESSARKKRVRLGLPIPSWFGFAPNFEPGALLSVAWANGKVSFVPMLFKAGAFTK
ncbi:hypothetical protein GGH94_005988 [Coemansia aciculifera]|uniref:WD40 repeat-like protein n=1 Tax=Coemansia aciculifera TaxID=417176 RepID=A0A9W8ICH7_9FUNG|nr:hypothetical protein GGH94_005988 [Coemansia aciculifera]